VVLGLLLYCILPSFPAFPQTFHLVDRSMHIESEPLGGTTIN
jgi:hypothetical protein